VAAAARDAGGRVGRVEGGFHEGVGQTERLQPGLAGVALAGVGEVGAGGRPAGRHPTQWRHRGELT
jgi:hypothetical protein